MGRTKGSLNKTPAKGAILRIRVHAEEKASIQKRAEKEGLSVTAWIVSSALAQPK